MTYLGSLLCVLVFVHAGTATPLQARQVTHSTCTGGWSAWINRNTPGSSDGDHEQMTSAELASFCPGGVIGQVDCQTVDGVKYSVTGEVVVCDLTHGLLCNNARNAPVECSDYEIRYHCQCPGSHQATTTPTPEGCTDSLGVEHAAGTSYKDDCNTCNCLGNNLAMCTLMACLPVG